MICDHYFDDKLTAEEAFRNLDEMVRCGDIDEQHGIELVAMVLNNEMDDIFEGLDKAMEDIMV